MEFLAQMNHLLVYRKTLTFRRVVFTTELLTYQGFLMKIFVCRSLFRALG